MWGPEPEPPGNEGADSHQLPLPEPAAQVTREEAGHKVPWPCLPPPGEGPAILGGGGNGGAFFEGSSRSFWLSPISVFPGVALLWAVPRAHL